jgi:hypothetical protein
MRDLPWPKYYVLVGRTPNAAELWTWAKAFENRWTVKRAGGKDPWLVGHDELEGCNVSTIFLGLDHNWSGRGDPVLFETLVFGGPLADEMMRYCTYAEAERGHAEMVTQARIAVARVKAIAEAAGVKAKTT